MEVVEFAARPSGINFDENRHRVFSERPSGVLDAGSAVASHSAVAQAARGSTGPRTQPAPLYWFGRLAPMCARNSWVCHVTEAAAKGFRGLPARRLGECGLAVVWVATNDGRLASGWPCRLWQKSPWWTPAVSTLAPQRTTENRCRGILRVIWLQGQWWADPKSTTLKCLPCGLWTSWAMHGMCTHAKTCSVASNAARMMCSCSATYISVEGVFWSRHHAQSASRSWSRRLRRRLTLSRGRQTRH